MRLMTRRQLGAHSVLVSVILLSVLTATPVYSATTPVYVLAIDPIVTTTLYAGGSGGVWKSSDGGATWSVTGLTRQTCSLAINPVTTSTIYAGTDSGIFKSADGGATWSIVSQTNWLVCSLAIDSVTPTTLYAGTYSGLFKSSNGGVNWNLVSPTNGPVYSLAIDSGNPTTLYAAFAGAEFATVFRSTDGGGTWSPTGLNGNDTLSLAIDPVAPTILYARYWGWGCDNDGCFTIGAISKSTDGGANWFEIDGVVYWGSWVSPQPSPSALAIDPVTSTTLYAAWRVLCGQFDTGCEEGAWTKKSSDGGASWMGAGDVLAYTFAIDPLTPTVLYAGTDAGVVKSMDGGATWSAPGAPPAAPPPPDTSPPDTSIISAADGTGTALANDAATLSASLTLTFTGADNVGLARFECRLDGAAFAACTSPRTYSGLALGRHTFDVQAVDSSSNVDATPARYTWTVDAAPETTIAGAIDGRGKSIANGGSTTSDRMTFRFTGADNSMVAQFECRLDAGSFTSCTSPQTYSAVIRGTHTFQVRAVDNNGFRDPSPAAFMWRR